MKDCCVPNCRVIQYPLHKFSTVEEKCVEWLKAINCDRLKLLPRTTLLTSRFVCSTHFERKYVSKTGRLYKHALPTIHLTETVKDASEQSSVVDIEDAMVKDASEQSSVVDIEDGMPTINLNITQYDFENICRTCLSQRNLKPLYKECFWSPCLEDILTSCTFLKLAKDDGLPTKICRNCINEINQAFSFVKRCEATDIILRECLQIKTELANNSLGSQKGELLIKTEATCKPEINFPNLHQTVQDILDGVEEIIEEEDMQIEFKPEIISPCMNQTTEEVYENVEEFNIDEEVKIEHNEYMEEVKPEKNWKIEYLCEEGEHEDQDETYPEKTYSSGSKQGHKIFLDSDSKVHVCVQSTCHVCGKAFNSLKYFDDDKRIHKIEKHIVCSTCKDFTQTSSFNDHTRIHTGKQQFCCEVCGKTFSCDYNQKRHMRMHTGGKPFTCEVCNKTFADNSNFKIHMKLHTGKKPYCCDICSKTFASYNTVKRHLRIHTGVKSFSCDICSKSFSQPHNLKAHMRLHTGEKPYTCEICSKAFARSTILKQHMRLHTGERPYNCVICNKTFNHSYSFKKHMSSHTGEKSYKCDVCSATFNIPRNLKNHKRVHTPEKT